MSSRQVRICPDCGTSLSVESTTCWLCKERSKTALRSVHPSKIQLFGEDRSPAWTITWTYQHRWTFYFITSLLYAGSLAFFELPPISREYRSLAVAINSLALCFFGSALAAGMILIIDLVFGARAFPRRLLEGLFWVLLTLAIFGGFLWLCDLSRIRLREIGSRCLALPLVIMLMQLPLWAVAYAKNWRLSRDDAQIDRSPWTIRDWMLGCFMLSASLALARASGLNRTLFAISLYSFMWASFVLLPAVLYGLLPRAGGFTSWGVAVHLLLLFFLFMWLFPRQYPNNRWDLEEKFLALILFTAWYPPPIIAVLLLRWSGYRLRAAMAAPASSQPVART